jgi:phospholipid/cholesterol/gamma-HCH transport system substrate-binding protein
MTPNRERVWVGLFVVIAVAVLSLTAIAVWGGLGSSGVTHRTYFKFSGGVQSGTPVRYGGMRVGTVRQVRIDPGDASRIEVEFVVDRATPLKTDSFAKIASLGPLSDNYIEVSAGTPAAAALPPGGVLNSTESVGLAQLGEIVQNMVPQINDALQKFSGSLNALQTTLARANDVLNDGNRSNLSQALARANDILNDRNRENLSNSLANLQQVLNDSKPKLSASLTSMNEAATKLVPLLDDMRKTSSRADQALSTLDSLLSENRQGLRLSVSELRDVLAKSSVAVDQLQEIMNQNTENLTEIIDNMRSSSVNMKNLTETIQSSPSSLIRGVKVKDRKPGGGIQK